MLCITCLGYRYRAVRRIEDDRAIADADRERPGLARPFRVPFFWLVCPLGVVACLFLFLQSFMEHWLIFVLWTLLGQVIYFGYGYRNSKLARR